MLISYDSKPSKLVFINQKAVEPPNGNRQLKFLDSVQNLLQLLSKIIGFVDHYSEYVSSYLF